MMKNIVPYLFFTLKAIRTHRKHKVSIEFMELLYRIEYLNKRDDWSMKRLAYELIMLKEHLPEEYNRYIMERRKHEQRDQTA